MKLSKATAILVLFLCGCKSGRQPAEPFLPRYGGTMNLTCLASLENLDPQKLIYKTDFQTASIIYEGLTSFSSTDFIPEPCLAERWTVLDDGTRIIFHLRDNVYFHDDPCFPDNKGRKLHAGDITYTFQRLASPRTASPHYYLFAEKITGFDDYRSGLSDTITGIRCLDSLTVEFSLTAPWVSFTKLLASPAAYIVPKEAIEHYDGNISHHPVGTGAFRLSRWKHLTDLLLTRHEQYWGRDKAGGRLPYLDHLNIRLISRPILSLSGLYKGDLHLISLHQASYDELRGREDLNPDQFTIITVPSYSVRFLGFSLENGGPAGSSRQLRRAIALGFNRRRLLADTSASHMLSHTFVPGFLLKNPQKLWFHPAPDQSLKILKKLPDSLTTAEIKLTANIDANELKQLTADMRALGLNPVYELYRPGYYEYVIREKPDIFRASFHPSYPDPEEYYLLFYSKNTEVSNLTGYRNPHFDQVLEQALLTQNSRTRSSLFGRLEEILKEDVPVLLLPCSEKMYFIMTPSIHGLEVNYNLPNFTKVWIEKNE